MFKPIHFTALIALGGLAACSSSGGGVSYDELVEDGEALAAFYEDAEIFPAGDLPTSGRATYNGYMGFEVEGDEGGLDVGGKMEMTADFDPASADPITGRVYDLASEEGSIGGSLRIDNSTLDRNADPDEEWQFDADLTGTLSEDGDDFEVNAYIMGDFVGSEREGARGVVFGEISDEDGASMDMEGGFVVER
ncbi:hypothetical protein [Limimaricola pyoseonensis]|uniref:Transferrin-binding protein B C-lobe/N-lobe beta barrel domain-containing protein n=1 Tax=Limimaricola pyoseonensis TaxID=521013 RepID=A0A1G6ZIL4_9RHOB|nr:hypothetical protein [Limimaricola pyoseonensis]SDE01396.1 hypothetical protein SAMN04488567_0520 [Limimaricola pyoseonensis]